MRYILFLLMVGAISGCTVDDDLVYSTLYSEGYTDVILTGWAPMACSDSERPGTGFSATRDGREISGVVCCTGYFFGACTIRH